MHYLSSVQIEVLGVLTSIYPIIAGYKVSLVYKVCYKAPFITTYKVNDNDPKLKVGDHVRISKYKNIFAKGYTRNWSEEVFMIKKVKNTVPWTNVINDLNGEEIIETFYEKELQKIDQQEFRIEKIIKKGDKLYVKWKGCDSSFNSWIYKKIFS